jgi:hypothetical protein
MSYSCRSHFLRISLLALGAALPVTLTGCGMGTMASPNATDAIAAPITGIIHGGPNPVVGAQVILYTTGSSYGVGNVLQEAKSVGGTHQDTSSTGSFSFTGGYTCPANSYAYVVAYGGNSGSGTNPNSVLMAALGPCSGLTSSTYIWIDELTTVAAGYALSNFINITYSSGTTTTGYVVGVGADAGNSAAAGCVANAYYSNCTTTAAAGMAHAFAMAGNLVSTSTGQANATTTSGATIPAQFINTLGNILQACVNSTGGGTTNGVPTTTTTASGTSNDGTICGMLSAYTSYTSTGASSGTLVAAGTTLGYIQNLAKHPSGSPTMFNSSCGSNSSGSTPAATCIFNLAPSTSFYTTSMTSAPPDWMLGIQYPRGSFNSTAASPSCGSATISTLGIYYPYSIATDINDNLVILNEDSNSGICYNLITIGFDGTPIGANAFDTSTADPLNVAFDAFGHAFVPAKGATNNGINVYAAGTGDSNIPKLTTATASSTGVASLSLPYYVAVDQNDNVFFTSRTSPATNNNGEITPSKPESHSGPAYTSGTAYGGTSSMNELYLDDNGVDFTFTSSPSGSGHVYGIPLAASTFSQTGSNALGTTSVTSNAAIATDVSGNVYLALDSTTTTAPTVVLKIPYTATTSTVTFNNVPTVTSPTATYPSTTIKPTDGVMDGNNVLWFAEFGNPSISGATVTPGHISGYDTVNNYPYPTLFGCAFLNAAATVCGSTNATTGSSAPYLAYTTRWLAIDSAGNIWLTNGSQGQVNEIIGLAAPTWPLYIHNGTSYKP